MMSFSQAAKAGGLLFFLFMLVACGYQPSSKYARNVTGEKISTEIRISAQDPENTVVIKDAVDTAVIEVFQASLVPKGYANTHLIFKISPPAYTPVQFDTNGFIVGYRATITLYIQRVSKDTQKSYVARGNYDFSVNPNAVVTDQQRFVAIKESAQKAIISFVAQVSAEGSRDKKE